jgi:hypothetical protein
LPLRFKLAFKFVPVHWHMPFARTGIGSYAAQDPRVVLDYEFKEPGRVSRRGPG